MKRLALILATAASVQVGAYTVMHTKSDILVGQNNGADLMEVDYRHKAVVISTAGVAAGWTCRAESVVPNYGKLSNVAPLPIFNGNLNLMPNYGVINPN